MNIILYLLQIIQYLYQQNIFLIKFICRYIPLKQWAFDDSHSPEYQKFKTDDLPKVICHKQDWDWNDLLKYYAKRYNKVLKPVARRKECDIPEDCHCPSCNAPMPYLYRNNGKKGQILCKVCQTAFSPEENRFHKQYTLKCPHCSHALVHKKDRKHFIVHKCVNPKSSVFTADETYIKVRGIKGFIWFIMDAASRSIIGYRVSDNRGAGPCILAMRQAFLHLEKLPKNFKFIADGYSAYPLAAQQFDLESKGKFKFDITQVIGLTNDDEVSKKHRPYKQMIERLNRTYKMSYRPTNGFDSYNGANYDLALWVAYYNFLRPHKHNKYQVLNRVEMLENAPSMPAKWQMLIFLGQQTILQLPKTGQPDCS
jgi:transposase-like protein